MKIVTVKNIFPLVLVSCLASACQFFSSILHDDSVVAKAGGEKLYRSEVVKLIPAGLPEQDSLQMALQYIESWASERIFLEVAEQQLPKEELDVTQELETYRRSLLKYRYEQLYVAHRLSQEVSDEEVQEYYDSHLKNYILDLPIAKARILRISAESPHKDELRQLLVTDDPARLTELDSLSYAWAEKYIDRSGEWMNLVDIGRQIGVDYGTILSNMSRNYAEIEDGTGRLCLIYFVDYMRSGQQAPLEFCRQSIQETLISMRKRRLILDLERDLLEQARQNGDFVIYEDQK